MRLGRRRNSNQTDRGALRAGAQQFKLQVEELRAKVKHDRWFRENCLIAVATAKGDGVSGLQNDSAFRELREDLESLADIMFSGNESDRRYWLGKKSAELDEDFIRAKYGWLKPCLHGSDAHDFDRLLQPDENRLCWIRSELSFDGLRQIVLDPELRCWIGSHPPEGALETERIHRVSVENADWLALTDLELNNGLIAIIGPRGSGKTALADIIAHGAGAGIGGDASFLKKAQPEIDEATVALTYGDGEPVGPTPLSNIDDTGHEADVRYLSQQFVERLCSADDLGNELVAEIEDVIFHATPREKRLGKRSFGELREFLTTTHRSKRWNLEGEIATLSASIAAEEEKENTRLPRLKKRLETLEKEKERLLKESEKLKPKDGEDNAKAVRELDALEHELDARVDTIQQLGKSQTLIKQLKQDHKKAARDAAEAFKQLVEDYAELPITPTEWATIQPQIPDIEPLLARLQDDVSSQITEEREGENNGVSTEERLDILMDWINSDPADPGDSDGPEDPEGPQQCEYANWSLSELRKGQQWLTTHLGEREVRLMEHKRIRDALNEIESSILACTEKIEEFEGAKDQRNELLKERTRCYEQVFTAIAAMEETLESLYAPIHDKLEAENADVGLTFYVRRVVDVDAWAQRGEQLLDLRKGGAFRGRGQLRQAALDELYQPWLSGDSKKVADAMVDFLKTYGHDLRECRYEHVKLAEVAEWMFSTDHIELKYGLRFDGVELSRLSPGMRGVVLLMLYLQVDQWDQRPLIIDQPEENLDPYSVYNLLVKFFRTAKRKRQIIIVTHNPNLVVNTDADQVIVASSERESPDQLPKMTYIAGALEDDKIREEVCRILEGGEQAFLEREARYRIRAGRE